MPGAALIQESFEFGFVLRRAQPVEEVAELRLVAIELPQRLCAVLFECRMAVGGARRHGRSGAREVEFADSGPNGPPMMVPAALGSSEASSSAEDSGRGTVNFASCAARLAVVEIEQQRVNGLVIASRRRTGARDPGIDHKISFFLRLVTPCGMDAVGTKIDALLKLLACASLMCASGSVAWYHLVYLPNQAAAMQAERRRETLRTELENRAEQQRNIADQQAVEERRTMEARKRYEACMSAASLSYDNSRASSCKRVADAAAKDRTNCIAKGDLSVEGCNIVHELRDPSPTCLLPRTTIAELDSQLEKAQKRCLEENKAGL
jgi:hypothetical protein